MDKLIELIGNLIGLFLAFFVPSLAILVALRVLPPAVQPILQLGVQKVEAAR